MRLGKFVIPTQSVNHLLYWMDAVDVAPISGKEQHVVDQLLDITKDRFTAYGSKWLPSEIHVKRYSKMHMGSFIMVVSPGMPFIFFSISVANFLVGEGVTAPFPSSLTLASGFSFAADASNRRHGGAMRFTAQGHSH